VGFVHEPIQAASAIEQRVLGVQMKMDKVGVRHGNNLPLLESEEQARDVHNRFLRLDSHGELFHYSVPMRASFHHNSTWATLLFAVSVTCSNARAEVALTIYNQNFAVVRDVVSLDLKAGLNQVNFAEATAFLEPSSVILRDPADRHAFQVLEQNYRADPVSQELLLALNEGKTIDFESIRQENGQTKREKVPGKIVRSGYLAGLQPIIETDDKLRFGLPGQPIFPTLGEDTILKPSLHWVIETKSPAKFDAEVSYVTGNMRWEADYNLVFPERGNLLDMVGWVTMENESGRAFEQARIKLMAGDVNKIQSLSFGRRVAGSGGGGGGGAPPVTEKSFDEYHLYTLERPATLRDREKKQVEFVRAAEVKSTVTYVYDGAQTAPDQVWYVDGLHTEPQYGVQSNKKVWVFREFTNSAANHLGLPLPKGRIRFYRRDTNGQMEFTGENVIEHTPRNELVRLITGTAFDLVGERKQDSLKLNLTRMPNSTVAVDPATGLPLPSSAADSTPPFIDESFTITLRNHKSEAVDIRVVEHLCRWTTWEIKEKSSDYSKIDAQTIEFPLHLKPDSEQSLVYTVHYWW